MFFFCRFKTSFKVVFWSQASVDAPQCEKQVSRDDGVQTDQSSSDCVHFDVMCQLHGLLNNAFGTMQQH